MTRLLLLLLLLPACFDGTVPASAVIACDVDADCAVVDGTCLPSHRCAAKGVAACGNRRTDAGEQCDDGNAINGDACRNNCRLPACGDGVLDPGEACDDGDAADDDACLSSCVVAFCGDGVVQAGVEECDDGDDDEGDACFSSCVSARCGDGVIQRGVEACDDGDDDGNDGCDACAATAFSTTVVTGLGPAQGAVQALSPSNLFAIARAPDDALYVLHLEIDRSRLSRVDGDQVVPYAGLGDELGEGVPAVDARIVANGLAVDGRGDVVYYDDNLQKLRRISIADGIVRSVAGNGQVPVAPPDGDALAQAIAVVDLDVAGDGSVVFIARVGFERYLAELNPAGDRVRTILRDDGLLNVATRGARTFALRVRDAVPDGVSPVDVVELVDDALVPAVAEVGLAGVFAQAGPFHVDDDSVWVFTSLGQDVEIAHIGFDGVVLPAPRFPTDAFVRDLTTTDDGGLAVASGTGVLLERNGFAPANPLLGTPAADARSGHAALSLAVTDGVVSVGLVGQVATVVDDRLAVVDLPSSRSQPIRQHDALVLVADFSVGSDFVARNTSLVSLEAVPRVVYRSPVNTDVSDFAILDDGTVLIVENGTLRRVIDDSTSEPIAPVAPLIAFADGKLFAWENSGPTLFDVDPVLGSATPLITMENLEVRAIAANADVVALCTRTSVVFFDRVTQQTTATFKGEDERDGRPAEDTALRGCTGLAFDGDQLYILDEGDVRAEIDGEVRTLAGPLVDFTVGAYEVTRLPDAGALALLDDDLLVAQRGQGTVARLRDAEEEGGGGVVDVVFGRSRGYSFLEDPRAGLHSFLGDAAGIASDGDRVWISDRFAGTVATLDAATWTVLEERTGLVGPTGLAVDEAGALFIAETDAHRVVRTTAGVRSVEVIAGTGALGFGGDGGPALDADLAFPEAVALRAGRVFIADTGNNRVRVVDEAGVITTLLGDGTAASVGDGAPARSFGVHAPRGLAFDAAGNLFATSTTTVRVLAAEEGGGVSSDGFVFSALRPERSQLNARVIRCLGGVVVVDDRRVRVADRCLGVVLELSR